MPTFSARSRETLYTCDSRLINIFGRIVSEFDCTILCGHRGLSEQNELFRRGLSKLEFPNSKHNTEPSRAVDVAPYPIDWNDTNRFYFFAGYVKGIAHHLGFPLRWGGDWDGDTQVKDQTFNDLVHYELKDD